MKLSCWQLCEQDDLRQGGTSSTPMSRCRNMIAPGLHSRPTCPGRQACVDPATSTARDIGLAQLGRDLRTEDRKHDRARLDSSAARGCGEMDPGFKTALAKSRRQGPA